MFQKTVNIKGQKYKVAHKKIDPNYAGLCHKAEKYIHINSTHIKTPKEALPVYAHELCHAYLTEHNLDLFLSPEIEELVCLMIEDVADKVKDFVLENKKAWGK